MQCRHFANGSLAISGTPCVEQQSVQNMPLRQQERVVAIACLMPNRTHSIIDTKWKRRAAPLAATCFRRLAQARRGKAVRAARAVLKPRSAAMRPISRHRACRRLLTQPRKFRFDIRRARIDAGQKWVDQEMARQTGPLAAGLCVVPGWPSSSGDPAATAPWLPPPQHGRARQGAPRPAG